MNVGLVIMESYDCRSYEREVRPVIDVNTTVTVEFDYHLLSIQLVCMYRSYNTCKSFDLRRVLLRSLPKYVAVFCYGELE